MRLVLNSPEILHQMPESAQRERENADGGGLVGAIQKYAGVADIKIRHIVGSAETIRHKLLGIITHAACSGLV